MDYEVVWTEPAAAEMEAFVRYILRQSEAGAASVRQSILDHVQILASFPFIGPVYPRARAKRVREIVSGNYRVFYRVDQTARRVEILTVWHGARTEPGLPE